MGTSGRAGGSEGRGAAADTAPARRRRQDGGPAALKPPRPDVILCGDAAARLGEMPDSSVDLVVTSPPYYRQRSYGRAEAGQEGGAEVGHEGSVEEYVDAVMAAFRECVRVTKDTGSIVFNMGDKYVGGALLLVPHRFAIRAMEDTGALLVNNITWVKTNPTPRQFQRRFVPSTEPFFHFAKTKRYYYDTGAYDADALVKRRAARENTTMGRQYERLIASSGLSGAEKEGALAALRGVVDEVKSGRTAGFRMKIRGIHAPAFGGQGGGRQSQMENNGFTIIRMSGRPIRRDVVESAVEALKWNGHPAVYPEAVVSLLIRTLSPEGAVVLDPYAGSGTTCVAAKKAGRGYIGIDVNPEYCDAARKRLGGMLQ